MVPTGRGIMLYNICFSNCFTALAVYISLFQHFFFSEKLTDVKHCITCFMDNILIMYDKK